jgi:hypothetical protein
LLNIDATKTKALKAIVKPDMAASLRRIFRWYSKTFSTPLHIVDDLPLEDILQAYFEDMYENMEAPLLEAEIATMSMSPAERKALGEEEEEEEEDFLDMIAQEIAKENTKLPDSIATKFDNANLEEAEPDFDPLGPTRRTPK